MIPAVVLKRVYEPGSLRNTLSGFEMAFKNRLAPTTIVGVGMLKIDDQTYDSDDLTLQLEKPAEGHRRRRDPQVVPAASVSAKRALQFGINTIVRLVVAGGALAPGEHSIVCVFKTKEVGDIIIEATDHVAE